VIGEKGGPLRRTARFCCWFSIALLLVAVLLNIIGLTSGVLTECGWRGDIRTLLVLVGVALLVYFRGGAATHFTFANMMPTWNWDTVNFWSQIAFAFTGWNSFRHERRSARPRDARCRGSVWRGAMIASLYVVGTFAILTLGAGG